MLDKMRTFRAELLKYGIVRGVTRTAHLLYNRRCYRFDGENIFSHDWDVLIILDACRADEFERIVEKTNRFPNQDPTSTSSIASCTWEWLEKTLSDQYCDEIKNTIYVTGNPHSDRIPEDTFLDIDEVWRYSWDDSLGTIPPRVITDRGISAAQNHNPDRLIIHYIQPHTPFIGDTNFDKEKTQHFSNENGSGVGIWTQVSRGEYDLEKAIQGYRENLELVLEEVDLLLENIDAEKCVITADHGEAFGENGLFGHPANTPIPALTEVPWIETEAIDEGTYTPTAHETSELDTTIETRLEDLGYK